jgi:hypothetical protein
MARVMLAVAMLGTVLTLASAVLGYWVDGLGPSLRVHLGGGFVALLLILLSQLWVLFFSFGSSWMVARLAPTLPASNSPTTPASHTVRIRWRLVLLPMGVCLALSFVFFLGATGAATPSALRPVHGLLGAAAPVLLILALWLELRDLEALDSAIDAADPET